MLLQKMSGAGSWEPVNTLDAKRDHKWLRVVLEGGQIFELSEEGGAVEVRTPNGFIAIRPTAGNVVLLMEGDR